MVVVSNLTILLMEEILHQLIGSLFHLQVFYIPGGAGFLPSTVGSMGLVYLDLHGHGGWKP